VTNAWTPVDSGILHNFMGRLKSFYSSFYSSGGLATAGSSRTLSSRPP
jgi:hypothetical protein